MSEHAHISPSGAHRHLRCLASLKAEAMVADVESDFAAEGTRAHLAATHVLNGDLEAVVYDDDAMAKHVGKYVELVRKYAVGGELLVEQKVDFARFVFDDPANPPMVEWVDADGVVHEEPATAFGTSDAVILKPAIGNLTMIDLKYGMGVKVDAPDNEQTMEYALGCLHEFDWLGPFTEVTMVIYQPRLNHISEHTISVTDLLAFAERAKARYAIALGPNPPFTPGDKQCKFCDVRKSVGGCAALKAEATAPVQQDADMSAFEDLSLPMHEKQIQTDGKAHFKQTLKGLSDEDLARRMRMVALVETWCLGVRAELETRMLIQGVEVPGYKIVTGRQGPRKWNDPEAVEKQFKSWRIKDDDAYKKELISPTTAETLFEGSPKRWKALQALITRSDGKPSVAPDEDVRPKIKGNVDLDAFAEIPDHVDFV